MSPVSWYSTISFTIHSKFCVKFGFLGLFQRDNSFSLLYWWRFIKHKSHLKGLTATIWLLNISMCLSLTNCTSTINISFWKWLLPFWFLRKKKNLLATYIGSSQLRSEMTCSFTEWYLNFRYVDDYVHVYVLNKHSSNYAVKVQPSWVIDVYEP